MNVVLFGIVYGHFSARWSQVDPAKSAPWLDLLTAGVHDLDPFLDLPATAANLLTARNQWLETILRESLKRNSPAPYGLWELLAAAEADPGHPAAGTEELTIGAVLKDRPQIVFLVPDLNPR